MAMAPDQELIRCLDSVQELLVLRHSLSENLVEGWLNMARARYSMGPARISQPLFSLKPYAASARVLLAPPDDPTETPDMTLQRLDPGKSNSPESQTSQASKSVPADWSQEDDAAYKRIMAGVGDSDSDSEVAVETQATELTRPVRWFGAFVSPQLHSTQTSFESAVEMIVKIANQQKQVLRNYNELMQLRDDMSSEAPSET